MGRRMDTWTPMIIVLLPISIGLLDLFLFRFGGNDATISAVMLRVGNHQPLVPLCTAYSFAVLMGHLFFPEFTQQPPPAYEVIARMCIVLSPTFYCLIIVAFDNGAAAAHRHALQSGGQWLMGIYMLSVSVAGGLLGKFGLPQHLPPLGMS